MSESLPPIDPLRSPPYRRGLHAFAVLTMLLTFVVLIAGGTVTSHVAGMSVPDWPRSFGYSMLALPWILWHQAGVFFEHSHRLWATLLGAMALTLMLWLWFTQSARGWLRGVGLTVLGLVIVQGLFGGFRVTRTSIPLAIVHGIVGQICLCATVLAAAATSRRWIEEATLEERLGGSLALPTRNPASANAALLRLLGLALLGALLVQLTLGAGLRHTGSTLAIPDFPTAYGQIVPPMDQAKINEAAGAFSHPTPYTVDSNGNAISWIPTVGQVGLAFMHTRLGVAAVALLGLWLIVTVARQARTDQLLRRPALALLALLVIQMSLGASVIWTGRQPEVATAHQAVGAATLATAFLLVLRIYRFVPAPGIRKRHMDSIGATPSPALQGSPA